MFYPRGTRLSVSQARQINYAHPLARGLVGCWLFNDGSSVPYDRCRTQPVAAVSANGTIIKRGDGLYQDGSSSNFINLGLPDKLKFNQTTSFTIHVSASIDGGSSAFRNFLRSDQNYFNRPLLLFRLSDANKVGLTFGSAGATLGSITSSATISAAAGVKRIFSCVRDVQSDLLRLHVDGQLDSTATDESTGTWTLDGEWQTRLQNSPSEAFNGTYQYVYVWNRALTAGEIALLSVDPYVFFHAPSTVGMYNVPITVFTGTSAVTAPAATLTASGTIANAYTGTSAVTAAAATLAASGTVVNPATNTGRLMLLGIG